MASSKNSNILIDTPQIIKRTRAQLRKLGTPSMIEMEIPIQENSETPRTTRNSKITLKKHVELVKKDTPKKTKNTKQPLVKKIAIKRAAPAITKRTRKSRLPIQTQIELANEVVRMQLAKKVRKINETLIEDLDTQITPDVKESSLHIKTTPSKVAKKATINKTEAVKRPLSESPKTTNKRPADSTQSPAKIRKVTPTKTQTPKKKQPVKKAAPLRKKCNPPKKKSAAGKEKLDSTVNEVEECLPELSIIKIEYPKSPIIDDNTTAAAVVSRKTSNASASNLSWTKDISSSSTTTCVTVQSNDFVRIDNKIPILKLTNVDSEVDKCKMVEEDDTTSGSESTSSSDTSACDDLVDLHPGSLNLSTSSPSVFKTEEPPKHEPIKGDVSKVVAILSSRLKNFDKEIMRWIGLVENIDNETKKFNDKIMKVLKEESNVIINCRLLKNLLSNRPPENVDNLDDRLNASELPEDNYSSDNPISKDNVLLNQNAEYLYSPKTPSLCTDDGEYNLDNFNCTSFDHNEEDDDALSIFAESITGIDSKSDDLNSSPSRADDFDEIDRMNGEDLAQPLETSQTPEPIEFIPTKTTDTEAVIKNVCEKQNADSTSIYKEPECGAEVSEGEIEEMSCDDAAGVCNILGNSVENTETSNQISPLRVTSIFHPQQQNQSEIFKGMCFQNLVNACKNQRCPYTHRGLTISEVENWLITLSEESFIKEYAYMRMRLNLRRKYGMSFVKECFRRGLIRNLVEMAIDFVIAFKPNHLDMKLQNKVLEYILEALNNVGLVVYEDLLNCPIDENSRFSHVLMSVIADSQNFTRFKYVFTNLTNVMVRNQQTFNMNVVVSLLERICVLPSEEPLLRAMFNIVKNTDPIIFNQKIMAAFEARLRTVEIPWLDEFLAAKNQHMPIPLMVGPTASPKAVNLEPLNVNVTNNDEERYTSPDTTNVDTLQNNSISEASINRTVTITRTCYNTPTPHRNGDWKSNKFNQWRHIAPTRLPSLLSPNLFARPVFRQRGHRYNYRTSHINYRPRPPRNF